MMMMMSKPLSKHEKKEKKGVFSKVKCLALFFQCERIGSFPKCPNKGFLPELPT